MLNNALRMIRVFHDLSQREMADDLGISKSYLSEIESGKKEPTLSLVQRYSDLFDIPASSILFFSENLDETAMAKRDRLRISKKVLSMLNFIAERSGRADA